MITIWKCPQCNYLNELGANDQGYCGNTTKCKFNIQMQEDDFSKLLTEIEEGDLKQQQEKLLG